MEVQENKDLKFRIRLKSIKMLKDSLQVPLTLDVSDTNFIFNISTEIRADAINKMVDVTVNVEIKNNQSIVLGTISVEYIFEVENFEDAISYEPVGKLIISKSLVEVLNNISISTTRGVMFSTFKGTFLNNAILPIIDPKQFYTTQQNVVSELGTK